MSDTVYLAVPRPTTRAQEVRVRAVKPLLRRLELGLLLVDLAVKPPCVAVAVQPLPAQRRRQPKARRALVQELAARTGDDNAGGSTRRPLMTVYREQALFIAAALQRFGPLSPKRLRALGAAPKTLSILHRDVYGWFERVDRALYGVKPAAADALTRYADVVARFAAKLGSVTESQRRAVTPGGGAGNRAPAATPAASPGGSLRPRRPAGS